MNRSDLTDPFSSRPAKRGGKHPDDLLAQRKDTAPHFIGQQQADSSDGGTVLAPQMQQGSEPERPKRGGLVMDRNVGGFG